MVRSKPGKPRSAPPPPPATIAAAPIPPIPPRAPRRELEPTEAWYLECLTRVTAAEHRGVSSVELANAIDRTSTPTYRMLTKLEALGYVARDDRGRFHPRPEARP